MDNIKKIDNELYASFYGLPRCGDYDSIWDKIKSSNWMLKEAIKPCKDKFGERDTVQGVTICDSILIDYASVDKEIYNELVNLIYSNTDIARIVLDGACNGGYSYLLMTLWNDNLVLTEEQKKFAVSEAMNKIGTTQYEKEKEEFSDKLDAMGITDDVTTILDIDGCKNPIGAKAGSKYMNFMFSMLSDTQAHGVLPYDIRYQILRNSNWTIEEKKKLVYDFFSYNETYDELLEQWEWGIINDPANYKGASLPHLDKCELYDYTYEQLLHFYDSKEITDRIWAEIEFCKLMHVLRPQQWEIKYGCVKSLGSI